MKTGIKAALLMGVAMAMIAGAANAEGQKGQKSANQVDVTLRATYGEISLGSGFTPDPYRVDIFSGGTIDATGIANGCTGMVARAPDLQLNYTAGSLPLIFGVLSDFDTTLVINGPNGQWYCDDDSGDGTNPLMSIPSPQSGIYDVYVGAYGGNSGSSQLYITELNSQANGNGGGGTSTGNNSNYAGAVDPFAAANYGTLNLRSGFTPDPQVVSMRAGGTINAQNVASHCRGYITRAPDLEVTYTGGSLPLIISVGANTDTTLVINGPDGQWHCDDDGGNGGLNPAVRFNNPRTGTYDIWVGTYSSGASQPATLHVSELYSQ